MKIAVVWCVLAVAAVGASHACADWKDVRNLVISGEKLTSDDEQEPVFRRAYTMAQRSVAQNPNSSHEHLWLANAAGRLAMVAPTKERIQLSKVVKESAERAITLDNKNGAAYMMLGAWHYYIANLSWMQKSAVKAFYGGLPDASFETAVDNLSKALTYGAENPVEVYYLRSLAYKELENDAAACADLQRCVQAKARNDAERKIQQRARKRLG